MRLVFIGVVCSGRACLEAMLEAAVDVVGIFTADKKRMAEVTGMQLDYFVDFEYLAQKYGVPLYRVRDTSLSFDTDEIKLLQPDVILCIGWPQLIKREILCIPKHGCIGMHPTLLPERRGGAPINWCLIDGLNRSGVTLFYLEPGLDSGDIIAQKEFEITIEDTAKTVLDKVEMITAELVKVYYPLFEKGKAPRIPQQNDNATYSRRRCPEDGMVDWRQTSLTIYNWIRALTLPFPGAFSYWNGRKLTIWESELLNGYKPPFDSLPGQTLDVLADRGIIVATGDSCIQIKAVEMDGESMTGDEFALRFGVRCGDMLG